MKINLNIVIMVFFTVSLFACEEGDEMVLDRTKSPVLVMIDDNSVDQSGNVNLDASIYELDKSGILDKDVGIDSIPVSGLEVGIYLDHNSEVETLTTNDQGQISFQSTLDDLGFSEAGEVRLELAGSHNDVNFREIVSF